MKIYPSRHNIVQTPAVNFATDIPLAYIDTDYKDYKVSIKGMLGSTGVTPVLPYQELPSENVVLFKANGTGASILSDSKNFTAITNHSSVIQRVNNVYQYIPTNATSYSPQEYTYSIIGKKNLTYKTQNTYNIRVGCIDNPATMNLAKNLIKIFGDAPSRGICPSNVWVNNKDISATELINASYQGTDFLFVETTNGTTLTDGSAYVKDVAFQDLLSAHNNIWVSVEKFPVSTVDTLTESNHKAIKNPVLFKHVPLSCKTFSVNSVNQQTFTIPGEEKEEVTMHHIFSNNNVAAIIKEYKDKGFVIYTDKSVLDNIEINAKLIYEIMMYVYSRTYLESDKIRTWITDVKPDYVVINNKLNTIDRFTSLKPIYKFFDLTANEVAFSKINISAENVIMTGIMNDYIIFKKQYTGAFAKYADPAKPNEKMLSIYTPQRTIMYFDDFVYKIEDDIEKLMTYERVENDIVFSFRSFKNTTNNINISSLPINDIEIPLTKTVDYQQIPIDDTTFYLCVKSNVPSYCEDKHYVESMGTIIAAIHITKTESNIQIYDMRRRGGGLQKGFKDDYNLLDIGSTKGLAYRKSGTIVITLPKRLEQYRELIDKVVKAHMIAEKFPVILFEGDDEGETP